MHENEELIHRLYMSLQQLDAEGMLACYHDDASFRDPVFILKSKAEISAMWTMLCSGAREFGLTFEQVNADDNSGSAKLEATYQFSQTNRKVLNKIVAKFQFKDGLIIEHNDSFNFWKWSRQALGTPGYLLGWSSVLQKKV
ncbi:MAG: nuclear transport factor 2 family protein, partial [Gracilimonas sp.]